jgi:xanthine dehydrogenase accessory factor
MREVISALDEALRGNQPVALATVVDVQGASPAQLGFKLLVRADGSVVGNVGGGQLEKRVREEALGALRDGQSRLFHFRLQEEGPDALGTTCGGDVTFFIEVYQAVPTLLIVGGGHLGQPLAEMARIVGFHVQVIDMEPERSTLPQLDPSTITPWTYVVLVTGSHASDERALRLVVDTPAAYVGMIGSQRKVRTIYRHLRDDGVSEERLAQVHAPIGLDLGGRSPAEIALAILAEVVQVRYGATGQPLVPQAPSGARS